VFQKTWLTRRDVRHHLAKVRLAGSNPVFRSRKTAHRNLAGSRPSPDDDRAQHTPVRCAGVEKRSNPVVLEVAEAESDAFDSLDQVVQRFGGAVGDTGQVVVAMLLNQF
jgi:hypothetical protein